MKVVVDDKIPYLEGILEEYFDEVAYLAGAKISAKDVKDADALLVRTRTLCNKDLLDGSKVKIVATATIGHDHIDKQYCDSKGIVWTNAPGCNAFGVVQYVMSALCELSRRGLGSLSGKTLGIVGVGEVGRRIASVAPSLGLKVLLNDPPRARKEGDRGFVSLDELVDKSDIITFHVPLVRDGVDKTYHLADETFFAKFGSPKTVVNASRGEVVSGNDLKKAIREQKVAYSVLDVWEGEPTADPELLEMVDIATPHIAGYSLEGKANGTSMVVRRLLEYFGFEKVSAWYPASLPKLDYSIAFCGDNGVEIGIAQCISQTYSIAADDDAFRANPDKFEQLRGSYGVRREMSYYEVTNVESERVTALLEGLTFKVKKQ